MLGDTVAIEVPSDVAPALIDRARRSCEAALGAGRCRMAHFGPEPLVEWRVVVTSDPEGLTLSIVLRNAHDPLDVRAERRLTFAERDPLERRWESAGAVVAALVAAEPRPQAASPPTEPPAPPSAVRLGAVLLGEPDTRGRVRGPWYAVDLGALAGPGLQHGLLRGGALLRGWLGIGLPLVALVETRLAASGGNPDVWWLSGAMGFGGRFGSQLVAVELSSAAIAQRMLVYATDGRGRRDSAAVSRFGGRLGLDVSRKITPRFDLFAGVESSVLRPGVSIEWGGERTGREVPVRWAGHVGLRFVPARPPPVVH